MKTEHKEAEEKRIIDDRVAFACLSQSAFTGPSNEYAMDNESLFPPSGSDPEKQVE